MCRKKNKNKKKNLLVLSADLRAPSFRGCLQQQMAPTEPLTGTQPLKKRGLVWKAQTSASHHQKKEDFFYPLLYRVLKL